MANLQLIANMDHTPLPFISSPMLKKELVKSNLLKSAQCISTVDEIAKFQLESTAKMMIVCIVADGSVETDAFINSQP